MQTHVKTLAVLHIVFGALGVLAALALLLLFGGLAGIVGFSGDNDAIVAVPILGSVGGIVFVFLMIVSLPGIIAGIGLLNYRPWARILTIVLSILHLLNFPFGTALGAYGLWVLFSREVTDVFEGRARYAG